MEEDDVFQKTYFFELDPDLRMQLLEQHVKANFKDNDMELYKKLWMLRYTDLKNNQQRVDKFLWQIVNLLCLYRVPKLLSRGTEKEIDSAMNSLGFSQVDKYGEKGRKILYFELRNAAHRYFSTCVHKAYGKKCMGIISMNENERKNKLANEVWQLTDGFLVRFETNDNRRLFCKAIRDEYIAQYPDAERLLKIQNEKHNIKSALYKNKKTIHNKEAQST